MFVSHWCRGSPHFCWWISQPLKLVNTSIASFIDSYRLKTQRVLQLFQQLAPKVCFTCILYNTWPTSDTAKLILSGGIALCLISCDRTYYFRLANLLSRGINLLSYGGTYYFGRSKLTVLSHGKTYFLVA